MLQITQFPLISDQIEYPELTVIVRELEKSISRNITGDVIELGCYEGTTSLFLQRVLDQYNTGKALHIYDSFNGLPVKTKLDMSPAGEQFQEGELNASKQRLINNFKHAGLQIPYIHKVWFEKMTSNDLPNEISFAFLDGDFYTSIQASLAIITPHLTDSAVIIIDDYQSEALPGARRAADEWAKKHKLDIKPEQSLGIIYWEN